MASSIGKTDMEMTQALAPSPAQVRFPSSNFTTIQFLIGCRYDREILEQQLFDKLIKKALAYVFNG